MPRVFYQDDEGAKEAPGDDPEWACGDLESKDLEEVEIAPVVAPESKDAPRAVGRIISEQRLGPEDQQSIWERLPLTNEQRRIVIGECLRDAMKDAPQGQGPEQLELGRDYSLFKSEDFEPESKQ